MNKTPSEAVALVEELKPLVANEEVDVVFCVPAIDIVPVVEAVKGTRERSLHRRDRSGYARRCRSKIRCTWTF